MADLIQEFFQRDLSEAEHEALGKLLEESPDAALRYEGLLEKNYLATGLPQPSFPRGLQSLPITGGALAKVLIVSLIVAGAAVWKFWPRPRAEVQVPIAQTAPMAQSVPGLKSSSPKENSQSVQPQPVNSSEEGQELSVVVDSPQTTLVTVRVLDDSQREVRVLYSGFVQPGHWSFQWDGILSDGQPAPAGDYRIDVQSGATHQTKDIKIKLK